MVQMQCYQQDQSFPFSLAFLLCLLLHVSRHCCYFIYSIHSQDKTNRNRKDDSTFVVFHRNVSRSSHLNINVGNGSYCQTLMDEGCKIKENYHHESMSVILGFGSLTILRFYKQEIRGKYILGWQNPYLSEFLNITKIYITNHDKLTFKNVSSDL